MRAVSSTQPSKALKPDRKSTRLNSSHSQISYAVFCLKKKNNSSTFTPACAYAFFRLGMNETLRISLDAIGIIPRRARDYCFSFEYSTGIYSRQHAHDA